MPPRELIGIDGCRGGWVVAASDAELSALRFTVVDDLEPLIARAERGSAVVAIDIPIGLAGGGPRTCDLEARRLLGRPWGSSVFPARPADRPSRRRRIAARAGSAAAPSGWRCRSSASTSCRRSGRWTC